jgi:formylglycine-generating enzyme required for sulfatase activity
VIPDYADGFALTSPVGSFPANAHGLYDMGGNMWQWCENWYDPAEKKLRVVRGASWDDSGKVVLLSSCRFGEDPSGRSHVVFGFRCILAEDSPAP